MLSNSEKSLRPRGHGAAVSLGLGEGGREVALAQLEKILRSSSFVSSPQLSRLLRFLVKESLAGRGDSLLQFRIGTEALGQPSGFDPETNAVVRVTCGRLRAKLKAYYETSGLRDSCLISLPRSGYQMLIATSPHQAGRVGPSPAAGEGALVGVLEFKGLGLPEKWQHLPVCLSEELVMLLCQAGPLRLRGPFSRKLLLHEDLDASSLAGNYEEDYIVDGSIEHRGGRLVIRARLLEGSSGIQLWSRKFSWVGEHWDFGQIETEIVQSIATELGADFGKIERHLIGLGSLHPGESLTVHEAILKAKAYELDYSERSYRSGVAALEQAIAIAPANALVHATLSVLLFLGYLENFNPGECFPARAVALASRALQLEPLGAWSRFAQVTAAFVSRNDEQFAALSAGLFADRDFPLGLLGVVALMRIYAGEEGVASVEVIRRLQRQNPHYPKVLHLGLSLWNFRDQRYELALVELDLLCMPGDAFDPLLRCAILFRQDRPAAAQEQYQRLMADFPGFLDHAPLLLSRYLHPEYVTGVLEAVTLAGGWTGPLLHDTPSV